MSVQGKSQGMFGGFQFSTAGQAPTTQAASSTSSSGFSFGANSGSSSGGATTFQFSTPASSTASMSGIKLGTTQQHSTPATGSFNLAGSIQQNTPTGGFNFGTSTGGTVGGFNFGSTPTASSQKGFSWSTGSKTTVASAVSTSGGFSFAGGAPSGAFKLGGVSTGMPMTSSLLGGKQTSSPLTFGAGGAPTLSQSSVTSAGTSGLNFVGTTKTPGLTVGGGVLGQPTGLSVNTTTSTTKTATGFSSFPGPSGGTLSAGNVGGGVPGQPTGLSVNTTTSTTKTATGFSSFPGPSGGTLSAGNVGGGVPGQPTGLSVNTTTKTATGFTSFLGPSGGTLSADLTTTPTPSTGVSQTQLPVTTPLTAATVTAAGLTLGPVKASSAIATTTPLGLRTGSSLTTTASTSTTTTSAVSLLSRPVATSAGSSSGPVATTAAAAAVVPQMTYKQVEDHINKWALELEEYEKTFLDQASQVNNWDRLLMENGEKITELNSNVETVKAEQKRLDQELDFIMAQQRDLEDMLTPLEESLRHASHVTGYEQHADHEREKTYKLAADIDGQLKQMVQDLKSIIDHLNLTNSTQKEDDPIVQIAKILNAHTNSLQWIDQNSALLQRKVDEVSKLSEARRKEQERNYRLAFD